MMLEKTAVGPRTVGRAIAQATEFGTHNYGRGKVQGTLERSERRADAPAGPHQDMGANERARAILQSGDSAPRSAKDQAALARAQVHNAVRDELALTSGLRSPQQTLPRGSVLPRPEMPAMPIPSTMFQPPVKQGSELQKLARLLKVAKLPPMAQQHALSDAFRAHQAAAPAGAAAARPIVRDPHLQSQHQHMMQNPAQYMPQGQVSSGLELGGRTYKRASELEKLAAVLKKKKRGGSSFIDECGEGFKYRPRGAELSKAASFGPEMQRLQQKLAVAPLVGAGLAAGARAAVPMIGRALAKPVGQMVGQQAVGMGMQAGMNALTTPKKLPGHVGG